MKDILSNKVVQLREEYQELNQKEIRIKELKKTKLKELQENCNHLYIAEAPYISSDYAVSTPPRRICEICGIEDDGWGCGYKILITKRARDISWDELYQISNLTHSLEDIEN